jgi:hypothetical protein
MLEQWPSRAQRRTSLGDCCNFLWCRKKACLHA